MNALSYNTERAHLHIPEYGRNVQNMINFAQQIESREERNLAVQAIIDVMGQLNPHLRDVEDYTHKLWTHLYIMSDFEIDVDCPYEIPELEKLKERPQIMKYPTNRARFGHFGFYTEKMIKDAKDVEDPEEKAYLAELYANLLKKNYLTFHTENVEDKAILKHLEDMSDGALALKDSDDLKSTNALLKEIGVKTRNTPQRRRGRGTKKRRK